MRNVRRTVSTVAIAAFVCAALSLALAPTAHAQKPAEPAPVSKALEGWTAKETLNNIRTFSVTDLVVGTPKALWYHRYASQTNKTAILLRRQPIMNLPKAIFPEIGKISAKSDLGTMTLDQYLVHPKSYAQGFVVLHKGKTVYESYPGMRELDPHFWASVAKVLASLAVDLLIDDGLIDVNKTLGSYVPEFRGSLWDNVKVTDALDMSVGLNVSEYDRSSADSIISRLMRAELGEAKDGKLETMLDVMRDAKPEGKAGESFIYSSTVTQSLVFLVEAVAKKAWSDFFDERVWSKLSVEGPLQVHLSPDGVAIVHGPVSSNLRDMARLGMLYTPSWDKVSTKRIVSPAALARIQKSPRTNEFFMKGHGQRFIDRIGDNTIRTSAHQWDMIFQDGDFFKSGLNGQGLYVSPKRDLVIAFFSTEPTHRIQKYLRPIVTSGLFDN